MANEMLDACASTCWPFAKSRMQHTEDSFNTDIELEWAARSAPSRSWQGASIAVVIMSLFLLLPASLTYFTG